jgi:acyl-CoA synthetase (NDP forming)
VNSTNRVLENKDLRCLFNPNGIAIVGASPDPNKFQGKILKYLIRHGYSGSIYPVNPSYDSVMAKICYPSLSDIPGKIDLVIVIIRSDKVLGALKEAVNIGCLTSIVISSDFAESGESGRKRQDQLSDFAKQSGMRILGPNCLGFINISQQIAASGCTSLEKETLLDGNIGLVTQSGALMGSIYGRAQDEGIGYSLVVSMGNEADIEVAEVIEYMLNDSQIQVVTGFIETFRDLNRIVKVSNLALEKGKPIIILKVGQSEKGRQAAATHTSAIAGSNDVANALFKKQGILRVDTIDQLFHTANLLIEVPETTGDGLGIFTISGGACGWLADQCQTIGIRVPDLQQKTKNKLASIFQYGRPSNPLDVTGQAISNQDYFADLLHIFIEDKNLDIILVGMTAMPFPTRAAEEIIRARNTCNKPLIVLWTFDRVGAEAYSLLKNANIPLFHSSDLCLKGIKHLIEYSQHRRNLRGFTQPPIQGISSKTEKINAMAYLSQKSGVLSEFESKQLLQYYGIPIAREVLVSNEKDAVEAAHKIGYPVVLKGISTKIIHKTEAGIIRLNLQDDEDVREAYLKIQEAVAKNQSDEKLDGVLVQEMISGGVEIFTGLINDQVFGPGIIVGLGGTYVELFGDKVIGIPPLSHQEALQMVMKIRGVEILQGYRGQKACDIEALATFLVNFSRLSIDLKDYISEIDINPVLVLEKNDGIKVIDATVKMHKNIV